MQTIHFAMCAVSKNNSRHFVLNKSSIIFFMVTLVTTPQNAALTLGITV